MRHELAVDAVQDRLEVVAFPGVLRVEQFQEAGDEVSVDVLARDFCLRRPRHHEAQEELVHNVQVRPCTYRQDTISLTHCQCGPATTDRTPSVSTSANLPPFAGI